MSANESNVDAKKAIDSARFVEGVLFTGKLFGIENVTEETGDEVCNTSMIKLKAIIKSKKEHKPPIFIRISLEGIEVLDQATKEVMHKHAVECISYIARDPTDEKAFGYIFKNANNQLQYIGLSHKPSSEIVLTLKDLFEVVYELKQLKKEQAAKPETPAQDAAPAVTTPTAAAVVKQPEPEVELLSTSVPVDLTTQFQQAVNLTTTTSTSADNLFDDLPVSSTSQAQTAQHVPLMPQVSLTSSSNDILLLFDAPKPTQPQQIAPTAQVMPVPVPSHAQLQKRDSNSDLLGISLEKVDKFYEIQKAGESFTSPLITPGSASPAANAYFTRPPPMAPQQQQQIPQMSHQLAYSPYNASQFTTVPQNSPINPSNLQSAMPSMASQLNSRNFYQPPSNNVPFGLSPMQQQQQHMSPPMANQMLFTQMQQPQQQMQPQQQQQFPNNQQFQW